MPFLAPSFIDKRAELRSEHIAEQSARRGRQSVQQDARGAVRCQNLSFIVDGQQARAERVQIFAAIVESNQDVAAMLFAEKPVLDLGRRHRDQRLGVGLP